MVELFLVLAERYTRVSELLKVFSERFKNISHVANHQADDKAVLVQRCCVAVTILLLPCWFVGPQHTTGARKCRGAGC